MLRPLVLACVAATAAQAETDVSAMIADRGLSDTETHLAALADPTPSEIFGLGGVQFLSGIEAALQQRWRVGLDDPAMMALNIPMLRLPIAPNPAPEPFRPAMIEAMFTQLSADMGAAADTLSRADGDVGLTVELGQLWFDVNANGTRERGEAMTEIAGAALAGGRRDAPAAVTVRFDTADAAWLSAYAHLLAGISDTIRAIGPTDPIARVLDTARGFTAIAGPPRPGGGVGPAQFQTELDLVAMILFALDQKPDPALSRAAHAHFLAMIADNRYFWRLVAQETDNTAEWIPNKAQSSALGLPFPPETATRWRAVLDDAEKVLRGELLIPHWRLGPGAGLDLGALFADPPSLDLVGLIQGASLLPYARTGPLADTASLRRFEALIGADAGLYAIILN